MTKFFVSKKKLYQNCPLKMKKKPVDKDGKPILSLPAGCGPCGNASWNLFSMGFECVFSGPY